MFPKIIVRNKYYLEHCMENRPSLIVMRANGTKKLWEGLLNSYSLASMWTWLFRGLEAYFFNMTCYVNDVKYKQNCCVEVLTAVLLKIQVVWNVMGYLTLANEGTLFLQNFGKCWLIDAVSRPRKLDPLQAKLLVMEQQ
jgi:hypothetical protein